MRIRLAPKIRKWAEAEADQSGASINAVVSTALERVMKLSSRAAQRRTAETKTARVDR